MAQVYRIFKLEKTFDYPRFGFFLKKENEDFLINQVEENSPASLAGLEVGQKIVQVDGHMIFNEKLSQVVERIKSCSNKVELLISRSVENVNKNVKVQKLQIHNTILSNDPLLNENREIKSNEEPDIKLDLTARSGITTNFLYSDLTVVKNEGQVSVVPYKQGSDAISDPMFVTIDSLSVPTNQSKIIGTIIGAHNSFSTNKINLYIEDNFIPAVDKENLNEYEKEKNTYNLDIEIDHLHKEERSVNLEKDDILKNKHFDLLASIEMVENIKNENHILENIDLSLSKNISPNTSIENENSPSSGDAYSYMKYAFIGTALGATAVVAAPLALGAIALIPHGIVAAKASMIVGGAAAGSAATYLKNKGWFRRNSDNIVGNNESVADMITFDDDENLIGSKTESPVQPTSVYQEHHQIVNDKMEQNLKPQQNKLIDDLQTHYEITDSTNQISKQQERIKMDKRDKIENQDELFSYASARDFLDKATSAAGSFANYASSFFNSTCPPNLAPIINTKCNTKKKKVPTATLS